MGCRLCQLFQGEEKNEYNYPQEVLTPITPTTEIHNSQESSKEKFMNKLSLIGKFISEEDFDLMIKEDIKRYMSKHQLIIPSEYQNVNIYSNEIPPLKFANGNIYHGGWNKNYELEGRGSYLLKEDNVFSEGVWKKGELIYARIFLPEGDIYEGQILNNTFNGKGKLESNNGEKYIGDFVNGEKKGEAKIIFEDGAEYEGKIDKGLFEGNGKLRWINGIDYQGTFSEGTLSGQGTLTSFQGDKYIGCFDRNLFHGKGIYVSNNGNSYEGDFEYGIRKGRGVYKKFGGVTFDGNWDNDLPEGRGKLTDENNTYEGFWRNGKIIEVSSNEKINISDLNFVVEEMSLTAKDLPYLQHFDISFNQSIPGNRPSFLEK